MEIEDSFLTSFKNRIDSESSKILEGTQLKELSSHLSSSTPKEIHSFAKSIVNSESSERGRRTDRYLNPSLFSTFEFELPFRVYGTPSNSLLYYFEPHK